MKTKFLFYLLRIFSFFFRPKIMMDGTDNTITINRPLLRMLVWLGINERNSIYIFAIPATEADYQSHNKSIWPAIPLTRSATEFKIPDSSRTNFGFCILPKYIDSSQTITRQLLYNTVYNCYGFEAACPTIQTILYNWDLPHDSILKDIPVTLHISTASIIYFSIDYR